MKPRDKIELRDIDMAIVMVVEWDKLYLIILMFMVLLKASNILHHAHKDYFF